MKRNADELRSALTREIKGHFYQRSWKNSVSVAMAEFSFADGNEYVSLRKTLDDANDFALFILTYAIKKELLHDFFTDQEIDTYSKAKWQHKTIKFPLVYPMVEIVSGEQWIGKISAQQLMALKDARIIEYNENTQRTMRHMIIGGHERYQIFLNQSALSSLVDLYDNGTFISNTITLNMPLDTEYTFNPKKNEMVIEQLDHFDIIDGYHRYIALQRQIIDHPDFEYDMELRIVCFDEEKAMQFIWQEDQKTKMKKLDSDAFNTVDHGNRIVIKLNNDPNCIMRGKINRNESIIDSSILAKAINAIYFAKKNRKVSVRDEIEITKDLCNKLNTLVIERDQYEKRSWGEVEIVCFVYVCYHYEANEVTSRFTDFLNTLQYPNYSLFAGGQLKTRFLSTLDAIAEGRES